MADRASSRCLRGVNGCTRISYIWYAGVIILRLLEIFLQMYDNCTSVASHGTGGNGKHAIQADLQVTPATRNLGGTHAPEHDASGSIHRKNIA